MLKEDGPKVTIPHGRKGLHFLSFYLFVSKESLIPETLSEMKTQKQQQQQQDITPNEVRTAQDIRRLGSKASAKEERLRRQDESFIIPNGKKLSFFNLDAKSKFFSSFRQRALDNFGLPSFEEVCRNAAIDDFVTQDRENIMKGEEDEGT